MLIRPCAELLQGLTSSRLSPSNLSAAHLAGFMGKELTSGRLPCYPSSVWKLIPSSVSKPRDPVAGGITWVSAVGASHSLLPPLWTADIRSTWTHQRKPLLQICLPFLHFLFTSPPASLMSSWLTPGSVVYQSQGSIDQAGGGQSCGWELCNSISCCRCRADLQMQASWKSTHQHRCFYSTLFYTSQTVFKDPKTRLSHLQIEFFVLCVLKRVKKWDTVQVITDRKQISRWRQTLSALSALCLYVVQSLRSQPLQSRSFPMRGKSEKSSLSFPLIICVCSLSLFLKKTVFWVMTAAPRGLNYITYLLEY